MCCTDIKRWPWGAWRLAGGAVGLLLTLLAAPAWAFDLSELMSLLAQRRSAEARFTEQRFVSGLDQPLLFSGTLSFAAPDRLSRLTLRPRPESFIVDGSRLTLERGGRSRVVQLADVPQLAGMVAALRGTLSGDGAVLRQHFRLDLSGHAGQWRLALTPLDERLAGLVKFMRLDGQRADLRRLEVWLADGDHSVMNVEPLPPAAPAAPAVRASAP